jgi:hypothetical protein
MKKSITIIAGVAAAHFALMYFTTIKTVDHNLSRTFTFFGTPPPDTSFTKLVSSTSAVLRQPLDFFLDLAPRYSEPKVDATTDQMLGWLLYALNSILWGVTICFIWYGFTRYRLPGQQAV